MTSKTMAAILSVIFVVIGVLYTLGLISYYVFVAAIIISAIAWRLEAPAPPNPP
jgi:hypothetical protein